MIKFSETGYDLYNLCKLARAESVDEHTYGTPLAYAPTYQVINGGTFPALSIDLFLPVLNLQNVPSSSRVGVKPNATHEMVNHMILGLMGSDLD